MLSKERADARGRPPEGTVSELREWSSAAPSGPGTRGGGLSPLEKEGAIRRFEYCLDLAWKAAKEFLEDSGLRIAPVTPREVLRQAAAAGVLSDGQVWIDMLDHRNLMAHNNDGVVFAEVSQALDARYFPAMEQLHTFLAARGPDGAHASADGQP